MQIFSFKKEAGKKITQYESSFIMSRIVLSEGKTHIACMHLEEGGVVGRHEAVVPQLLLIIEGKATVSGEGNQSQRVQQGDAVFWEKGEMHETTSDHGMMAIVVEGESLDPSSYMPQD